MALPKWQERLASDAEAIAPPPRIAFENATKHFAVDVSGSTAGAILRAEGESVQTLATSKADTVCKWSDDCTSPVQARGVSSRYWQTDSTTEPLSIIQQASVVDKIRKADLWLLYTDGDIYGRGVTELTTAAESAGVIKVPIVVFIFGHARKSPEKENISVGISFFSSARDAVIIYKDVNSKICYVIKAKGAFEQLQQGIQADLSDWHSLAHYKHDNVLLKALNKITFDPDRSQRDLPGVSLGQEWDAATDSVRVKVPELLEETTLPIKDISNLLQEDAFGNLALACKLRDRLSDLRSLVSRHKQLEITVQLEDRHGAADLIRRLRGTDDVTAKSELSDQLRQAHAANRATYQQLKENPSEDVQAIMSLNRQIDKALQVITGLEKSGYTADILDRKSNRAMRAAQVSAADTDVKLAALDLSDGVAAFKHECSICAGEDEIMSIVLKKLDSVEENTTDFALNFPLAAGQAKQNANIISSQSTCFQCALLLERSIYQEDIVARLPTVSLRGANMQYMIQQLYLGLTARLATGASGVIQLFSTILDQTITTKSWCADNSDDDEAQARRKLLIWMLNDFLRSCPCRENFAETGAWVKYPQALQWAMTDFKTNNLDSWIIQYPIAGFTQLLRWYQLLSLDIPATDIEHLKTMKLVHFVATKMMADLFKAKHGDRTWHDPYLNLLYRSFNAPGVPKNLGASNLVDASEFCARFPTVLNPDDFSDATRYLQIYTTNNDDFVSRLQALIYYALYHIKSHVLPKGLFTDLKLRFPLAIAILDPNQSIPSTAIEPLLLTPFIAPSFSASSTLDFHNNSHTPFVTPFGPSVLKCGVCAAPFYPNGTDLTAPGAEHIVREGRKQHLTEIYGLPSAPDPHASTETKTKDFAETTQTGLPDATAAPNPPTSAHYCLHISVAKVWARMDVQGRLAVLNTTEGKEAFVDEVVSYICTENRRGNVYSAVLERDVMGVLPSFEVAVAEAVKRDEKTGGNMKKGKSGKQALAEWEFRFEENTLVGKMRWEIEVDGARRRWRTEVGREKA